MPTILAVLVYLVAMGLPVLLLQHFHSQHWLWHTFAVVAAVGLGFVPIPPEYQRPGFDLLFGFVFISLMIWGAGGLILYHSHGHREKHA
ncbi:MAG TPA: hypothetical protein VMJ34_04460 [Bryobacteraceae bacterium]|nr:hypothetical protein [Bryobacteraceae bacterium]